MIQEFDNLTGQELEAWFKKLFSEGFSFENYFPTKGQIDLSTIDSSQSPGNFIEIDGILLINKTLIFLEYTSEGSGFKEKIKKFIRNVNLFVNAQSAIEKIIENFQIPDDKIDDFEEIENFKYVYFGTNQKFQNEDLDRSKFPDFPLIQKELYIIKPNTIEYLRRLSNQINSYSKNELLALLDFTPLMIGEEDESIKIPFIKAEKKYITTNKIIKADVYLFKIKVEQLLRIAKVSRYEGIPFILEDDGENNNQNFQRLLIDNKLENISKGFLNNDKRKLFPNTITLVLNEKCKEEKEDDTEKLVIPKKFCSVDIIDGQHRLYSYTKKIITKETRENSEILATAIKFSSTTNIDISKNSAKVFVEINSNQAKVKNNLIYLIKYDVLGDRDYEALAGKTIQLCNSQTSSKTLANIFLTNSLIKKNKLNTPPIPITTIVDSDLIPLMKGVNTLKKTISEKEFQDVFGKSRADFEKKHFDFCSKNRTFLEHYFSLVKKVFKNDWKENSNSFLISSKYISAFIRLLRYYLFEKKLKIEDIEKELIKIKKEIDKITNPSSSATFPKSSNSIPSTKHGINTIYSFLKDTKTFKK